MYRLYELLEDICYLILKVVEPGMEVSIHCQLAKSFFLSAVLSRR